MTPAINRSPHRTDAHFGSETSDRHFGFQKRTKIVAVGHISSPHNMPNRFCGWDSARDPTGEAYSAPDFLAVLGGHSLADRGREDEKVRGVKERAAMKWENRGLTPKMVGWVCPL